MKVEFTCISSRQVSKVKNLVWICITVALERGTLVIGRPGSQVHCGMRHLLHESEKVEALRFETKVREVVEREERSYAFQNELFHSIQKINDVVKNIFGKLLFADMLRVSVGRGTLDTFVFKGAREHGDPLRIRLHTFARECLSMRHRISIWIARWVLPSSSG